MAGRVVVVTGANSGIGFETAVALAALGAHVVLCARDPGRGERAVADAAARVGPSASLELAELDLADLASVEACAAGLLERHPHLHVLVNNAGGILRRRQTTVDGFEATFGVNHLGHFFLTRLLTERLRSSAPARVVNIASGAHRSARGGLPFDDLQSEGSYRPFTVYARSKLANILFTRELARRLDGSGVTANAVHPGYVASRFGRDGDTGVLGSAAMILGRPFAISSAKGARTSVHVASAPALEDTTGAYFVKCRPTEPSAAARDDDAAQRLWELSDELLRSVGR